MKYCLQLRLLLLLILIGLLFLGHATIILRTHLGLMANCFSKAITQK